MRNLRVKLCEATKNMAFVLNNIIADTDIDLERLRIKLPIN